jgi:hypothetical protein
MSVQKRLLRCAVGTQFDQWTPAITVEYRSRAALRELGFELRSEELRP